MLTVRLGTGLDDATQQRARAMAQAIGRHPLARHLDGTVIVGPQAPGSFRQHDARPRIAVALRPHATDRRLGTATIERADVVVVAEQGAQAWLAAGGGDVPVVRVSQAHQNPPPFLAGAAPDELRAAWDAVARHPELALALGAHDDATAGPRPDALAATADAVMEAVVVAGHHYTRGMERPAG